MRRVLLVALLAPLVRAGEEELLRFERAIPLPDVKGRLDHLVLWPDGDRLAAAALGNDTIEIVDLKEGRVAHRVRDIPTPTAGAFVGGELAMAAAGDGKLHFLDGTTLRPLRAVEVGLDADPVRVDGARFYVGFGEGGIAVVDGPSRSGPPRFAEKPASVLCTIPLAAHPEGFQLETKGPRIFVNVPDAGHVAVVDRERRKVVAEWKLDAKDNYPMALDEERGHVLVGCRRPPCLLVLEAKDGSVQTQIGISGDVDDLFLDAMAHRLYAICGEGFVDVLDQGRVYRYDRVARIPTSPGARTGLLDAERGRLFVAAPARKDKPAEILVYRVPGK